LGTASFRTVLVLLAVSGLAHAAALSASAPLHAPTSDKARSGHFLTTSSFASLQLSLKNDPQARGATSLQLRYPSAVIDANASHSLSFRCSRLIFEGISVESHIGARSSAGRSPPLLR
jgi:hypothetical protein